MQKLIHDSALLRKNLRSWRFTYVITLLFLLVAGEASAQLNPFDTTATVPDSASLRIDSVKTDSLTTRSDTAKSSSGIDTVVTYSCSDSITYQFKTRLMSLYKNSTIAYQQMELKSELIGVDWNTNIVSAVGVPDSTDTLHGGNRGTPVMKEGSEKYEGIKLAYNFQTRKGKIDVGDTKVDEGFYHGEDIKKVDTDILFVARGRFTTCDAPHPHFYFGSPKMKVTMQDKVVAEPIYLYIADVPVFALPFAVFPNKGGRRSGIIAPAYGEDGQRGRFLRHLGYYWAINEYFDWNVQADLYTKGGWAAASRFQYNLRYYLNGGIHAEYKKLHTGEDNDPAELRSIQDSYRISVNHNQDIDPTTRFNVDFTFASDNAYQYTLNRNEALQQIISSNATLSKHWESPNSISLNVSRQQYLVKGDIYETLPSLNFSHGTSYPFRGKKTNEESSDMAWYEMIGLNYGLNASNTRSKATVGVYNVKVNNGVHDTLITLDQFQRGNAQQIGQSVNIGISPKVGYVTVSPSLSFQDSRNFSKTDIPTSSEIDSTLTVITKKEARRAGTLSTGIAFTTRLYGIVQPNALGMGAFRHTLSPALSFIYDRQVYGDNPDDKNIYANLGIGNLFEMKTIPPEQGKDGKKITLLNVNLNTSYNFTADSLNLSPLSMSFRTGLGSILDASGGATYDFYKLQEIGKGVYYRVNKFLVSEEGRLARLTNFRIGLSTRLSGEKKKAADRSAMPDTTAQSQPVAGTRAYGDMAEPDFSIPWQLQMSWDYSESRNPAVSRSSGVNGTLDFNLTDKWKFGVQSGYDIVNKEFVYPRVTISRDLHCWLMNFSWTPIGYYRSFQFEIKVKASQLQDLKVTKSRSNIGY